VRPGDADAYVDYVTRTGIARHRSTPGNVGSMMLVRADEDEAEVVVLSLWNSMDAIRQFAGGSAERAVFFPEDARYLIASDSTARHYEVRAYATAATAAEPAYSSARIPHRVYANGRVQSLGFGAADGDATVGVVAPGSYRFTATLEEHVTVLAGELDVRRAGTSKTFHVGETYVVPAGADFEIHASKPAAYHCRFVPPIEARS
jgi:uncharacterized protein YaiE (UPF0345 family)/heme-degrading monooxygenase HmoA